MARKVRVLALHSFRTSPDIFKEQLRRSGIDSYLDDIVEFIFVRAPHPATGLAPDDVLNFFQPPFYEWWNLSLNSWGDLTANGADEAFETIGRALRENAPIDGIVGFSQGGAVTSIAAGLQRAGTHFQDVAPIKFVLCFAGVRMSGLFDEALEAVRGLPSMHVLGDKDPVKRKTLALIDAFEDPIVIHHSRGHVIPRLSAPDLERLRAFVLKHGAGPPPPPYRPDGKALPSPSAKI